MIPRCYTKAQLLVMLDMANRTFQTLKASGQLVFLEELKPRVGRRMRFRADLVDRWLANEWRQPGRSIGGPRKIA